MRAATVAIAAIAAPACAILACQSTVVFEPPPAAESAASLVLFADDGVTSLAFATRPIATGVFDPPLLELSNVADLQLSAASYACALEELELPAGPLEVGDPRVPLAHPMALAVRDGDAWNDRLAEEDQIARFDRLPWRSACESSAAVERDGALREFDGDEQASAAFANGDVLIYTTDRRVILYAGGALSEPVQTGTKARDMVTVSGDRLAFVDVLGRVFLIDRASALQPERWQRIDARFEPASRGIVGLELAARPGFGSNGGFELLAVTEAGTIELFDGAQWIRLYQHDAPSPRPRVVFKDADEARTVGIGGPDMAVRIDLPTRTVIVGTVVNGVPDQCVLTALGYVEALGWVYGTCDRLLIEGRPFASDVGASVTFLMRLSPTVLLAGGSDGYALFDAHRPECWDPEPTVEIDVSHMLPAPGGLTWIGGLRRTRVIRLRSVPPLRERPACQLEALP